MKVTIDLPDNILEEFKEILLKEDNFEYEGGVTFLLDVIARSLSTDITAEMIHEMLFQHGAFPSDIFLGSLYFDREV